MMSKGAGGTRSQQSTGIKTGGKYGMKMLGKIHSEMSISGRTSGYSYQPSQEQIKEHAYEYLSTGKFDAYGSKAAPLIAKEIARDLKLRGAHVNENGKYLETYDGLKVLLSKNKNGSWKAKVSSSSYNTHSNSSMKEALWNVSSIKK